MAEVFLSYAAADAQVAARIRQELENAGIQIWSDANIEPGDNWSKEINDNLKRSAMGVVLLSPASLNSAYVAQEYQYLLAQNKPLYVATIEHVEPKNMPYYLQAQEAIDLSHDLDSGVTELKHAIQERLEHPGKMTRSRRSKSRVTLTVELDTDEIEVADVLSKLEHLLESDGQQIRVVSVESESDLRDQTRNTRPAD